MRLTDLIKLQVPSNCLKSLIEGSRTYSAFPSQVGQHFEQQGENRRLDFPINEVVSFAGILNEALLGTIRKPPPLAPVQWDMITLPCLIVRNRELQIKQHLGNALNCDAGSGRGGDHSRHLV